MAKTSLIQHSTQINQSNLTVLNIEIKNDWVLGDNFFFYPFKGDIEVKELSTEFKIFDPCWWVYVFNTIFYLSLLGQEFGISFEPLLPQNTLPSLTSEIWEEDLYKSPLSDTATPYLQYVHKINNSELNVFILIFFFISCRKKIYLYI